MSYSDEPHRTGEVLTVMKNLGMTLSPEQVQAERQRIFEHVNLGTVGDELHGLYKLAVENADLRETLKEALALLEDPLVYRTLPLTDVRINDLRNRIGELCP